MIAYLKGSVLKKTNKGVILDTGNIGYFVYLTKTSLSELNESQKIEFFIHTQVKEDILDLYGFTKYEDLEFFNQLISVNGIGPKVGLEILSIPSEKIKSAIINKDESFICQIHGIGKKTAQRLILELKDKIELEGIENLDNREYKSIEKKPHSEALDALIKLGYQRYEIAKFIKDLPEEIKETEEIITYFLKNN